eukprot:TRINITY_DN2930_c0_g2_i21.p1 TRINITY_DN2930_c0_g2~~TRINITY_DN2930_c0_g2_i21.p1  ORF type:complete len:449 (+),score=72.49 TRINITY_DN2930_c0_g2_i21:65-1411(+)
MPNCKSCSRFFIKDDEELQETREDGYQAIKKYKDEIQGVKKAIKEREDLLQKMAKFDYQPAAKKKERSEMECQLTAIEARIKDVAETREMKIMAKVAVREYLKNQPVFLGDEHCLECFTWKARYESESAAWVEKKKAPKMESKDLSKDLFEENKILEAKLRNIAKELENSRQETELILSIVQINRTFKSSFYKYWYNQHANVQFCRERLEYHLTKVVKAYCERNLAGIADREVETFIKILIEESQCYLGNCRDDKEIVPIMCRALWMSEKLLEGKEFCSMLNEFLRIDLWVIMKSVAYIARGINQSCVVPPRDRSRGTRNPQSPVTTFILYRLSAVPQNERGFFEKGKLYRCPMYLATSSRLAIAERFSVRGRATGCTRFEIEISDNLCHGRELGRSPEFEHLFPPYSVFKVISTTWMDPSDPSPSLVRLLAQDNLAPMEELPVSTWH